MRNKTKIRRDENKISERNKMVGRFNNAKERLIN